MSAEINEIMEEAEEIKKRLLESEAALNAEPIIV